MVRIKPQKQFNLSDPKHLKLKSFWPWPLVVKFIYMVTERYGRKVYHGTPINVAAMVEIVLMISRTSESSHRK